MVHRDLNPDNIMMLSEAAQLLEHTTLTLKIIDFNFISELSPIPGLTQANIPLIGTLQCYMSPEQL